MDQVKKIEEAERGLTKTGGQQPDDIPLDAKAEEDLLKDSDEELAKNLERLGTKDQKVRLSGAARKRMRFLIKSGVTPEEARQKALKPMPKAPKTSTGKVAEATKASKRPRSEGSTPEVNPTKKVKRQAVPMTGRKIAYSQAAKGIKMGITARNYPEELLTTEQMAAVQEAIMDKVREQGKKGSTKPHFYQAQQRPGWLAITCADEPTAEWLGGLGAALKPWEGADLRILEDKDMPHSEILIGYLPGSQDYSNEKILATIEAQNDLKATVWRVLRRNPVGPTLEVTLSVDTQSINKLEQCRLEISYKFGQLKLRRKGKKVEATPEGEPTTSTTSPMEIPEEIDKPELEAEQTSTALKETKSSTSKKPSKSKDSKKSKTRADRRGNGGKN